MPERYLLDTNAAIALLADTDALDSIFGPADRLYLSIITLGELFYGAWKSTQVERNLLRVEALSQRNIVVGCDSATAREYGLIYSHLRRKGRPIPINDIWIAAQARQHDFMLVTRDAHFEEVDELRHVSW